MQEAAALLAMVTRYSSCAPNVGPRTMAAVVAYESGGRPWAIGDNTAHRAIFARSRVEAEATARGLLARGHNLDLGLAQINTVHLGQNGLSVANAFDPCVNLAAGARVLGWAYLSASRAYGPGQLALRHALSAYNTGSLVHGMGYARGVELNAKQLGLLAAALPAHAAPPRTFAPLPAARQTIADRSAHAPASIAGTIGDGEHLR